MNTKESENFNCTTWVFRLLIWPGCRVRVWLLQCCKYPKGRQKKRQLRQIDISLQFGNFKLVAFCRFQFHGRVIFIYFPLDFKREIQFQISKVIFLVCCCWIAKSKTLDWRLGLTTQQEYSLQLVSTIIHRNKSHNDERVRLKFLDSNRVLLTYRRSAIE